MSSQTPAADGTITYRGRSLEEVLPKIREELGPDAVIERQRTGLIGGVGGFFQREMVEVDARPGTPAEDVGHDVRPPGIDVLAGHADDDDLRAATAPPGPVGDQLQEGLSSPGIRRIVEQTEPFADLLAGAERAGAPAAEPDWEAWDAAQDDDEELAEAPDWDGWAGAEEDDVPPTPRARFEDDAARAPYTDPAGAYRASAQRPALPPAEPPRFAPSASGPAPTPPAASFDPPAPARERPAAAAAHERALVAHGLSPALAETVVAETLAHAAPFAAGARGGLKRQVRATLARRIPVQAGFGGAGRTIALVGPAGAGKTRAVAGIAAAYNAGSSLPVVCLTLRPHDVGAELAALLEPHGVAVRPVADGAAARAQIGARAGEALVLLDTPAASPRDGQAIARLAEDLRVAGVTETHVTLAATLAAPVARAALEAFAPVGPAALLLTHADETDHLGPLVELAVASGHPLSYVAAGSDPAEGLAPADPAALAARLLP